MRVCTDSRSLARWLCLSSLRPSSCVRISAQQKQGLAVLRVSTSNQLACWHLCLRISGNIKSIWISRDDERSAIQSGGSNSAQQVRRLRAKLPIQDHSCVHLKYSCPT